jgi:hypothetical protein
MNSQSSWHRVGDAASSAAVHSKSSSSGLVKSDLYDRAYITKALMAQWCELFYDKGWGCGTGGGCSIRYQEDDDTKAAWRIFAAPSGMQKEDLIANDMFELDMAGAVVERPLTPNLKLSGKYKSNE